MSHTPQRNQSTPRRIGDQFLTAGMHGDLFGNSPLTTLPELGATGLATPPRPATPSFAASSPRNPFRPMALFSQPQQPAPQSDYREKELAPVLLQMLDEEGSNFVDWLSTLQVFMEYQGVFGVASGAEPVPLDPAAKAQWLRKDLLARAQFARNIPITLFGQLNKSSSASILAELHDRFSKQQGLRYTIALTQLHNKRIGPNERMSTHIAELRKLRAAFLNAGGVLETNQWRMILMMSLAHEWSVYKAQFANVHSPEDMISTLLLEEVRLDDERGIKTIAEVKETALKSQATSSSTSRASSRSRFRCENCNVQGHTKDRCYYPGGGGTAPSTWTARPEILERINKRQPLPKANPANNTLTTHTAAVASQISTSASIAEIFESSPHYAFVSSKSLLDTDVFIVDSGASSHMVFDPSILFDFKPFASPQHISTAKAGDPILATGYGSIRAQFDYQGSITNVTLINVLLVPDLDVNLLSVSKLVDAGIKLNFLLDLCTLTLGDHTFAAAHKNGSLYQASVYVHDHSSLIASSIKDISQDLALWHRRLAHISECRIRALVDNEAATGIILKGHKSVGLCEPCILGKQHATSSPSANSFASAPFDVIHSDIQYFINESFSRAKYALIFVDECSRFTWLFPLKEKTGAAVFDIFKTFDTMIETQRSTRIKAFHSDNGGEYSNLGLADYFKTRGIEHRLIAPHRHEMNGLAERMNRTIADAVRAMLQDAKLPPIYWAHAANYFVDIHNVTPHSSSAPGSTPYQVIYGSKPDISHFRVFGCPAYARVPPEFRKKLDPKSRKGIFVGIYNDAAYKIMLPSREIVKSKDVIFDELHDTQPLPPTTDDSHVSTTVTPSVTNPIVDSIARSRPKRADHTSSTRLESIRQESAYEYMDNPIRGSVANFQRRIVAGHSVPLSMTEALAGPDASHWKEAGQYELDMLKQHDVWNEVPRPIDTHVIKGKWVFNIKQDANASLVFRARWVARGDSQLPDEFGELHANTGDFNIARTFFAICAAEGGLISTIDIKSAYLHSPLDLAKPIYVEYPTGFSPLTPDSVCELKKALYGLRQGARAWQDKFSSTLANSGYKPLVSAPSAYRQSDGLGECLVHTHVDDCNAICFSRDGSPDSQVHRFEADIKKHYEYSKKDLSTPSRVLGWDLSFDPQSSIIRISVRTKIENIAIKYGLQDSNSIPTPMAENALALFQDDDSEPFDDPPFPYAQAVGELLWLAMNARPDIAFSVIVLTRFLKAPKSSHWTAVKRIIRYLIGTKSLALTYSRSASTETKPIGFCDSDWARDPMDRKSVSGFVFIFAGAAITWKVKRQTVVALSTAEAEYLAASLATREAVWFRHFFQEIDRPFENPLQLFGDNQAAIKMSNNPVYQNKTKHIDIAAHHLRDECHSRRVSLTHIPGSSNPGDIFTKPLPPLLHSKCVSLLGLL